MNTVDYIIIILFIFALVDGWRRSFLVILLDIFTLFVALLLANAYLEPFGEILGNQFSLSEGLRPFVSFVILFGAIDWLIGVLVSLGYDLLKSILTGLTQGMYARLGGIFIALVKQWAVVVLAVNLLLFLPVLPQVRNSIETSSLTKYFVTHHPAIEGFFTKIIEPAVYEAQRFITTNQVTDEAVPLDIPIGNLIVDKQAEQELMQSVNEERIKRGLKPLSWNEKLAEVGRAHSQDMWERQYFSHINPDGKNPFDRLQEAGVHYIAAGENLAMAPTTPIAHRGLMDSPKHRENILSPDFGAIGIGVVRNGLYGAMYTQMFKD